MTDKIIVIGGSAGSFTIVTKILSKLPKNYKFPIIMCLHRLKHIRAGFAEALSIKSNLAVVEPFDKQKIEAGKVFLAPANYHMYVNKDRTFTLSIEEPVNHSRPAIDITFVSASHIFKDKMVGIILSGANNDGAYGFKKTKDNGGITIIQNPDECQVTTMPMSCVKLAEPHHILNSDEIINFLIALNNQA